MGLRDHHGRVRVGHTPEVCSLLSPERKFDPKDRCEPWTSEAGMNLMNASGSLEEIAYEARGCTLCRLHVGRAMAVAGEGPRKAALFLIGEAPGRQEDEEGRPFIGMAGRILDEALREAGLDRSEVFITNAVKCRPPDNRNPRADEMEACRSYLLRQIECVRPSVIVTLGKFGLRSLIGRGENVSDQRERDLEFQETPVVATYHPAGTRYNRFLRDKLLEDLRRAENIARGR
ncbi:MAG: uracil-DNA glycosylase [Thermoplasmata archaeon]